MLLQRAVCCSSFQVKLEFAEGPHFYPPAGVICVNQEHPCRQLHTTGAGHGLQLHRCGHDSSVSADDRSWWLMVRINTCSDRWMLGLILRTGSWTVDPQALMAERGLAKEAMTGQKGGQLLMRRRRRRRRVGEVDVRMWSQGPKWRAITGYGSKFAIIRFIMSIHEIWR